MRLPLFFRLIKLGIAIFLLVVLVVGVMSCRRAKKRGESIVRIGVLKGPSAMSMVRLMEKGFEMEARKAEITIYNEPAQVQALMIRNELEIALIPGNMSAVLYARGVAYKLMSVPVWGTLYLAGEDSSITSWDQLKGKKVFLMARGATPDVIFRILLQKNSLDPSKDLTLDYTFAGHLELFTAITAGRAPIGILAEPFLTSSLRTNPKVHVLLDLEKEWRYAFLDTIPLMQTALMVQNDFASENIKWLAGFHKAYSESMKWIEDNHGEAGRLCTQYGIIGDSVIASEAYNRAGLQLVFAGDLEDGIFSYFRLLFAFNPSAVGGVIPDSNIFLRWPEYEKKP